MGTLKPDQKVSVSGFTWSPKSLHLVSVKAGSPAEEAGFGAHVGKFVREVNGNPVFNDEDYQKVLATLTIGDEVIFTVHEVINLNHLHTGQEIFPMKQSDF